jgi:hypothetical protein
MRALVLIFAMLAALPAQAQHIIQSPGGGSPPTPINSSFTDFSYRSVSNQFNDTTPQALGVSQQTTGTASAVNSTIGDLYARFPRMRYSSSAALNSVAAFGTLNGGTFQYGQFTREQGFRATARIGFPNGFVAGNSAFCGLVPINTVVGAGNLTTALNVIYIGFHTNESTWRICAQNAVPNRECTDLGVAIGDTGFYTFTFFTVTPNGSIAYKWTKDSTNPPTTISTGILSFTTIPAATIEWRVSCSATTGTQTTAVVIEPSMVYYQTPYF